MSKRGKNKIRFTNVIKRKITINYIYIKLEKMVTKL